MSNSSSAGGSGGAPSSSTSTESSIRDSKWFKTFKPVIAGALTGAIESFITYPTEYVKTQVQLQNKTNPQFAGIGDCFVKTVRDHGLLGLYRGMSPILVGSIPKQSVRWGTYETCSNLVRKYGGPPQAGNSSPSSTPRTLSAVEISVCGFVAGITEAFLAVVPTETVKTKFIHDQRQAVPKYSHLGLVRGVAAIVREEGFGGVYRGVASTVVKQGLNQAIRFPVQRFSLGLLCSSEADRRSAARNGVAGVMAGIVSVVATQPFDVIKSRMQGLEAAKYNSTAHCWIVTVREGGLGTLYAGSVPRMLRVGLNVGLTFTVFPFVKQLLG